MITTPGAKKNSKQTYHQRRAIIEDDAQTVNGFSLVDSDSDNADTVWQQAQQDSPSQVFDLPTFKLSFSITMAMYGCFQALHYCCRKDLRFCFVRWFPKKCDNGFCSIIM